jgi:predicted nucleic acid-binding protein
LVAQSRGLAVRETLGCSYRRDNRTCCLWLKPVLDALNAEGFRMAPALVQQALEHVGEISGAGGP